MYVCIAQLDIKIVEGRAPDPFILIALSCTVNVHYILDMHMYMYSLILQGFVS